MKLKQKLMAAILVVVMLAGYVATLTDAVIAAGVSLAEQSSKTNHTNVEFNSYFEGEDHSKGAVPVLSKDREDPIAERLQLPGKSKAL